MWFGFGGHARITGGRTNRVVHNKVHSFSKEDSEKKMTYAFSSTNYDGTVVARFLEIKVGRSNRVHKDAAQMDTLRDNEIKYIPGNIRDRALLEEEETIEW